MADISSVVLMISSVLVHKSKNKFNISIPCVYIILYKLENIATSIISFIYIKKSVNEECLDLHVPIMSGEAEP